MLKGARTKKERGKGAVRGGRGGEGRSTGARPSSKKGRASFRHGLTGAFTLARSLLPPEKVKEDGTGCGEKREGGGERISPAYVGGETTTPMQHRREKPPRKSGRTAPHGRASRRPPVARADRRRRRLAATAASSLSAGDDISKSSVPRIRDTFASSSYLNSVYIASVIKETYPFLPKRRWK